MSDSTKENAKKFFEGAQFNDVSALEEHLESVGIDTADPLSGWRALHAACYGGAVDSVKWLVSKGADLNVIDNKDVSPLHIAARSGNIDNVITLCEAGARTNLRDLTESTPLHIACAHGFDGISDCLLHHNAHNDVLNKDGISPVQLALFEKHVACVGVMLNHGVVPSDEDMRAIRSLFWDTVNFHINTAKLMLQDPTAMRQLDGDEKADSHWATLQSNLATMANTVNERV